MSEGPKGLEVREAHYPRRAPIDAYGRGGFRFAGMSHRGSLICVPTGIYAWEPPSAAILTSDLERVFGEAGEVNILLLGVGPDIAPVDPDLRAACREAGIVVEAMATGAAVRTFNVLLADDRPVAAALVAVD